MCEPDSVVPALIAAVCTARKIQTSRAEGVMKVIQMGRSSKLEVVFQFLQ